LKKASSQKADTQSLHCQKTGETTINQSKNTEITDTYGKVTILIPEKKRTRNNNGNTDLRNQQVNRLKVNPHSIHREKD
jgi:hypothetical protein